MTIGPNGAVGILLPMGLTASGVIVDIILMGSILKKRFNAGYKNADLIVIVK